MSLDGDDGDDGHGQHACAQFQTLRDVKTVLREIKNQQAEHEVRIAQREDIDFIMAGRFDRLSGELADVRSDVKQARDAVRNLDERFGSPDKDGTGPSGFYKFMVDRLDPPSSDPPDPPEPDFYSEEGFGDNTRKDIRSDPVNLARRMVKARSGESKAKTHRNWALGGGGLLAFVFAADKAGLWEALGRAIKHLIGG